MADLRGDHASHSDTRLEAEARALAKVYSLALRAYERKKGAETGAPDNVRRNLSAHTTGRSIPG